jgi:hypothetical protein
VAAAAAAAAASSKSNFQRNCNAPMTNGLSVWLSDGLLFLLLQQGVVKNNYLLELFNHCVANA